MTNMCGRGLGFVEAADGAGGVEEGGGGGGVHGLDVGVLLRRGDVALRAGRGGDDGEPDDAFGGPSFCRFSMLPLR